jgi:hypothetical protein
LTLLRENTKECPLGEVESKEGEEAKYEEGEDK